MDKKTQTKQNLEGFFYTLRDTECNSYVFGPCEVCGKTVVQVFHQCKFHTRFLEKLGREVTIQVSDIYGHSHCLIPLQKI